MPMMYTLIVFAPYENHDFLASTIRVYREIIEKAKQKALNEHDACEIKFAIGQASHKVHTSKRKYHMPLSLKEEISFMRHILMDNDVHLSTPLGHILPRDFKWV